MASPDPPRWPWRPWLLAAPAVVLLAGLLLGPLLLLLRVSLMESAGGGGFYREGTWTLRGYADLLGEHYGRDVLAFTVALGVGVAATCVAIGYPLALFIHGLSPRPRRLALAAVVLPKLASVLVVVHGLQLVLGASGPISRPLLRLGLIAEPLPLTHSLAGAWIAETYLILPYAVLVLVTALGRIDPALVSAARGLGATPWQAFRRVTLPLSLPGLVLAGELALIWGLGAFVGPILLGGPGQATLAVVVERQVFRHGDWPRGAATAVVMAATLAACLALYRIPARHWLRERGPTDG